MGADYYEAEGGPEQKARRISASGAVATSETPSSTRMPGSGDNVVISPEGKDKEMNGVGFYIRDGIVVIPKSSVIPPGLGYNSAQPMIGSERSLLLVCTLLAGCYFDHPLTSGPSKDINTWLLGVWEHKDAKGRVYRARVVPMTGDRYFVSFHQARGRKETRKKSLGVRGLDFSDRLQPLSFPEVQCQFGASSRGRFRLCNYQVIDQNTVVVRPVQLDSPPETSSSEHSRRGAPAIEGRVSCASGRRQVDENLRGLLGAGIHRRATLPTVALPAFPGTARRQDVRGRSEALIFLSSSRYTSRSRDEKQQKTTSSQLEAVLIDEFADAIDGNCRGFFKRISVDAGADRGKADAAQAVFARDFERTPIA